jgi:superfamily I DNA/RNA helicase
VLDQSGYLKDLREERSEEAEGRIENLLELVSAAREYETRNPNRRLAALSISCRCSPTSTRSPARATRAC